MIRRSISRLTSFRARAYARALMCNCASENPLHDREYEFRACAVPAHSEMTRLNQRQLAVDHEQHPLEFMAAAQDQAGRRDHAVHALLAGEPRIFLDPVDRDFGGATENGEHRAFPQEIDGVVAPFAIGDHAAIQIEDAVEFETVECDTVLLGNRSGGTRHCAIVAWISVLRYGSHGAPPHLKHDVPKTATTFRDHGPRIHDRANRREPQGPFDGALRARPAVQSEGNRVTGSLEESYCCPTSAHRPPRCFAKKQSCVGPVLSVPDSSAPSPPGPSGSGLFAGENKFPVLGPTRVGPFLFWGPGNNSYGSFPDARLRVGPEFTLNQRGYGFSDVHRTSELATSLTSPNDEAGI